MQPLISILIPAYNAEQWIVETLKSALAQTWQHKQIIAVAHPTVIFLNQ